MNKQLAIFIITLLVIGCNKIHPSEKLFDTESIESVDLINIDNFWDSDISIDTSVYPTLFAAYHEVFRGSVTLYTEDKYLELTVFTSQNLQYKQ